MKDEDQVTLREFMLVQLEAVEDRFAQWVKHSDDRLTRTEKDLERRLEGMNEFRAQLTGQAKTFLAREYYEREHRDLTRRIEVLENYRSDLNGRFIMLAGVLTFALVILGLLVHWWR